MKLILASKEKYLLDKGYSFLDIPLSDLRIGIINTALKTSADEEYLQYMKEYIELMKLSGVDFKEIDIDGKTEEEVFNFFTDRNVIQINGGNPFFLLKKAREVNLESILKRLLSNGLSYVGCSGGSSLMTPTIEVGGWKQSRERFGVEDLKAFNYVPFLIKCHYTDDKKEEVIEKSRDLKYPLRLLRDNQCFLVEDDKCTFIGDSEEVILN